MCCTNLHQTKGKAYFIIVSKFVSVLCYVYLDVCWWLYLVFVNSDCGRLYRSLRKPVINLWARGDVFTTCNEVRELQRECVSTLYVCDINRVLMLGDNDTREQDPLSITKNMRVQ